MGYGPLHSGPLGKYLYLPKVSKDLFGRASRAAPAGALPNARNSTNSGCGAGARAPRGFHRRGEATKTWLHPASPHPLQPCPWLMRSVGGGPTHLPNELQQPHLRWDLVAAKRGQATTAARGGAGRRGGRHTEEARVRCGRGWRRGRRRLSWRGGGRPRRLGCIGGGGGEEREGAH
jgi:hypothetical protein